MNDWQRSFLAKLETARKQWLHKFETCVTDSLNPVFNEFHEFMKPKGFNVSAPRCESGTRRFKFGLTENGYMLIAFRWRGLETMEVRAEIVVPGSKHVEPTCEEANLCDVDQRWARQQFERALDRFIVALAAAGVADTTREQELAPARA